MGLIVAVLSAAIVPAIAHAEKEEDFSPLPRSAFGRRRRATAPFASKWYDLAHRCSSADAARASR
jgi:hypothetical protein